MSGERGDRTRLWWLVAGPSTGIIAGVVLGAGSGWLTTPAHGVGPLVGDPVGSTLLGALVGMTVGAFAGLVLGVVLMVAIRPGQSAPAAPLPAAALGAVCWPAVLVVLATIGRVDLGQLGPVPFAVVAAAGAGTAAWLRSVRPAARPGRTASPSARSAPAAPRG